MDHDNLLDEEGPQSRGARMLAIDASGFRSRAENTFFNPSHVDQNVRAAHAGLMESCYHRTNLEDPVMDKAGYSFYVCEVGPEQREFPDGSKEKYDPLDLWAFPVMYYTTTFGGPMRTLGFEFEECPE